MLLPANLLSINFNTSILQSKANFFVAIKSVVFRNPLSLFIIDWLDIHKKVLLVFLRSSEQNISNDLSKCPYLKSVTWFGFEYLGCKNLHEWLSCNFMKNSLGQVFLITPTKIFESSERTESATKPPKITGNSGFLTEFRWYWYGNSLILKCKSEMPLEFRQK